MLSASIASRFLTLASALPALGPSAAHVDEPLDALVGGQPKARALVVALHGGSWTGRTPRQLAERLLADLDGEARRAGLRLVVPIAPAAGRDEEWQVPWLAPPGEALVLRVLSDEIEARRADPRRLLLAGHGAGATAALHLAARHPELVAAVAAWSGTPAPLWDGPRRGVGLVDDPVAGLSDVAVYLWTGADDDHLDREALELFTDGLRRQRDGPGSRPLLIESGPGGHGFGDGPRAGLRFLAGQRKSTSRGR